MSIPILNFIKCPPPWAAAYSKSPSPRLSLALFLLLLHQAIHTKIRATRIVLKLLRSGQKQNLQAFFENCAGNAANCSENLHRNWSIKELCADRKRARNFCAGNAFPAQTKLYSLGLIRSNPFVPCRGISRHANEHGINPGYIVTSCVWWA